jgi:RNA recognition motif-containing protein
MNIFVAQLNFRIKDDYLKEIFDEFGSVTSAKVIMDKATGRSKGFGFVEMANDEDGEKAIEKLNGTEVEGKTLVVKKAVPRNEYQPSGGRGEREHRPRRNDRY